METEVVTKPAAINATEDKKEKRKKQKEIILTPTQAIEQYRESFERGIKNNKFRVIVDAIAAGGFGYLALAETPFSKPLAVADGIVGGMWVAIALAEVLQNRRRKKESFRLTNVLDAERQKQSSLISPSNLKQAA